jgi:hypothetical protein
LILVLLMVNFFDVYWKLYHDISGGFIITIYGDIDGWSSWFNNGLWWLIMVPLLMFIIWWILMVDDNGWYWFFSWRMFFDVYWKLYHDMEKLWSLYMVILMVDEVDLIMVYDDLSWFPFWCLFYGEYWWLMIMVDTSSSHGECFMMFIGNYIMIFMEELWSLYMVILVVDQVDLIMVYDDLSRFFSWLMLIMVYIWWLNVYIYMDFQMEEWMVYNVFFMGL